MFGPKIKRIHFKIEHAVFCVTGRHVTEYCVRFYLFPQLTGMAFAHGLGREQEIAAVFHVVGHVAVCVAVRHRRFGHLVGRF